MLGIDRVTVAFCFESDDVVVDGDVIAAHAEIGASQRRKRTGLNGQILFCVGAEFIARKGDSYIGIPLKDLNLKKGSLVSIIVHQGKIIVPFGNDHIEENDHVVIISVEPGISDLNEVLYK